MPGAEREKKGRRGATSLALTATALAAASGFLLGRRRRRGHHRKARPQPSFSPVREHARWASQRARAREMERRAARLAARRAYLQLYRPSQSRALLGLSAALGGAAAAFVSERRQKKRSQAAPSRV